MSSLLFDLKGDPVDNEKLKIPFLTYKDGSRTHIQAVKKTRLT